MSSEFADNVKRYISYFRTEREKFFKLDEPLHQKLLVVAMLSALAEGRYPTERSDKAKFTKLIHSHSNWSEVTAISISQLEMDINSLDEAKTNALSKVFVSKCSELFAEQRQLSPSSIHQLDIDPLPKDFFPRNPTTAEKKLANQNTHSSLLYRYRCKLVHEFRESGYGMEISDDVKSPYYHAMSRIGSDDEKLQLVYPTQWFLELPVAILSNLEEYYLAENINPYNSYKFGSKL